jgi:hypothetical protein
MTIIWRETRYSKNPQESRMYPELAGRRQAVAQAEAGLKDYLGSQDGRAGAEAQRLARVMAAAVGERVLSASDRLADMVAAYEREAGRNGPHQGQDRQNRPAQRDNGMER